MNKMALSQDQIDEINSFLDNELASCQDNNSVFTGGSAVTGGGSRRETRAKRVGFDQRRNQKIKYEINSRLSLGPHDRSEANSPENMQLLQDKIDNLEKRMLGINGVGSAKRSTSRARRSRAGKRVHQDPPGYTFGTLSSQRATRKKRLRSDISQDQDDWSMRRSRVRNGKLSRGGSKYSNGKRSRKILAGSRKKSRSKAYSRHSSIKPRGRPSSKSRKRSHQSQGSDKKGGSGYHNTHNNASSSFLISGGRQKRLENYVIELQEKCLGQRDKIKIERKKVRDLKKKNESLQAEVKKLKIQAKRTEGLEKDYKLLLSSFEESEKLRMKQMQVIDAMRVEINRLAQKAQSRKSKGATKKKKKAK